MKRLLFLLLLIPTLVFGQFKGLTYGGKALEYGGKIAGAGEFPPTGLGDIYYVSTSGDDAKDGLSEVNAWATLAYAETNAPTGATIALKRGDTWALDNVLEINQGGVPGDYTTWDGALWGTGDTATIQSNSDGGASPKYRALVHVAGCSYVTFQNIRLDGNNTKRHGFVVGSTNNSSVGAGPTAQNNEHHIILQNCNVFDVGDGSDYEIAVLVSTWNNDIWSCSVLGCVVNGSSSHGISFYGAISDDPINATPSETRDSYIGYNTVMNYRKYTGNVGYGIHVNNKQTGVIVEHNTVTTGGSGGSGGMGIMIDVNESQSGWFPSDYTIKYNYVKTADAEAFWVQGDQAQTGGVYGNVFWNIAPTNGQSEGTVRVTGTGANAYSGGWLNFFYNTILCGDLDNYSYAFMDFGQTSGFILFRNNLIVNMYDGASAGYGFCYRELVSGTSTHDHNLMYCPSAQDNLLVKTNLATYAKSVIIATWEATAVITDPTFTSATNFHLQTGTPAGFGVTVSGITLDIEGVAIGTPIYVGAYQTIED